MRLLSISLCVVWNIFRDKRSQDLWKIMLLLFFRDFICTILTFNANDVQASLVMLWFDKTRERHANLRTALAPVKSSWKNRQEITPSIRRYRFNGENFVIGSLKIPSTNKNNRTKEMIIIYDALCDGNIISHETLDSDLCS